jgi:diguanylate cyclase (GGDEF)-like protein/PAS domain S-box-containing protein
VRKSLPVAGMVMACTCLVLAGCCVWSLYALSRAAPSARWVELACAALLAGCAIVSIRRQRSASSDAKQIEMLLAVADALPMRVAYLDMQQRFRFVNRSGCERHGVAREALLGRPAAEFVTAFRSDRGAAVLQSAYDGHAQRFEHDDLMDGRRLRLESHLQPDIDSQGRVRGVFVTGVDITALSRQTVTLNAVIESMPAMVAVVDPQLRYRLVNQAYERWLARPRAEIVDHSLQDCMSGTEYQDALPFVQRALAGETVTYDLYLPAAQTKHVGVTLVPLRLEDGSSTGFICIAQDATAQREEQDRLLLLSERDPLTGLLNRAGFERFLSIKVERGDGYACGLLYIDLDRFKPINDEHGHAVGDEVLREFASRIRTAVRPTDAVARLGGDEFAVVLSGLREPEDAAVVAQKIVELARLPFVLGEQVLLLSASVGVAVNADVEGGWQGLVQRADALLYQAKHAGRARMEIEPRNYLDDGRLTG